VCFCPEAKNSFGVIRFVDPEPLDSRISQRVDHLRRCEMIAHKSTHELTRSGPRAAAIRLGFGNLASMTRTTHTVKNRRCIGAFPAAWGIPEIELEMNARYNNAKHTGPGIWALRSPAPAGELSRGTCTCHLPFAICSIAFCVLRSAFSARKTKGAG
jgi:hypothetical protein